MIYIIILIFSLLLPVFLIVFYILFRYKVIKYINEDTRIVVNRFTRTKYEQALDHYGWFNMKRISASDLLVDDNTMSVVFKNLSCNIKKKKLKKIIKKLENKRNESNSQYSRCKSLIQFPEKLCDGGIGRLFPSWYNYTSGRDNYFGLY